MMETTLSRTWQSKADDGIGSIFEHLWIDESRLAATTRRFVNRLRGAAGQSLARLFGDHGRQLDAWMGDLRDQASASGIVLEACEAPDEDLDGSVRPSVSPRAIIAEVLSLHDRVAEQLRNDLVAIEYCDEGGRISRPLNRLLEFHETTAWMLRVLLSSPELVRAKQFGA